MPQFVRRSTPMIAYSAVVWLSITIVRTPCGTNWQICEALPHTSVDETKPRT